MRCKQLVIALLAIMMSVAGAQPALALRLEQVSFDNLPGWQQDDHSAALQVFVAACGELTTSAIGFARKAQLSGSRRDWLTVCRQAKRAGFSPGAARRFFEDNLVALNVSDVNGQFTGYFEPEVEGSRSRSREFSVPVLARPDDLVKLSKSAAARLGVAYGRVANGVAQPYFTRRQIEQGQLASRNLELLYLKSWADLFFMQIQGSGRVRLREGGSARLGYAAKTGLPYTAIGKVLIDRRQMTREEMSMQALRAWLKNNPDQARQVMWENKSYVFFRELPDTGSGPIGAQQLPLTPLRSLAVDRRFWALGVPLWVSTTVYANGRLVVFDRLMVAQDTGSAIRGAARGDVFMGSGRQAGLDAGGMDQAGDLTALVPRALATRLLRKHGR
ncbi:murein transglycosylase A [Anderseniella sp. Alg231-50]|uniref:murein transglycosylase A n=1 Tax=Anderseniella sp. Alg231-50 TaxID=1922226 RepID=UPI00307BCDA8